MNRKNYKKCFAALLAASAVVSSLSFVGAANETTDKMNEEQQPTAVHFYNVTEEIVNEDGSLTLAFHNLTVQGEEVPKPEKDNISISNGGSVRQFAKVKINKSIPNSMTFTMDNLAYQPYQNIIIAGTCDKPGVELYFKLYRYVGGSPVLISSSQVTTTQEGIFSWRSSYGASGNYAIKVWTNKIRLSENSLCSISGNLIY